MRTWRSACAIVVTLAACGADTSTTDPVACDDSILTYKNFGEPFLLDWCRGCHSSNLSPMLRQGAPEPANFDDLDRVRSYAPLIVTRATGPTPTMPAGGGPSDEERALLAEWLACGAH